MFKNPTRHFAIINLFGESNRGMTREEVVKWLGEVSSGDVSSCLEELADCGFLRRIELFRSATGTRKGILPTLVTTFGLKRNANAAMITNVVTIDDLFRS